MTATFQNISIAKRLVIIQLVTAFIAVLICCSIFVFNNIKVFKNSSVEEENSIAKIIGINAASTLEFADRDAASNMLMKLKSDPSVLDAIIFDKNGREFARYDRQGEHEFEFPKPGTATDRQRIFDSRFVVTYPINEDEFLGTVMLRAQINGFRQIIWSYFRIAMLILLASLVAAFIISNLLQRSITSRLLSLVNRAGEVAGTHDYSLRVPAGGKDEIGMLSNAFNDMLVQIEMQTDEIHSFNQQLEQKITERTTQLASANKELEAFSYSVSHDLRAPLRAINSFARILEEDYKGTLDEEGNRLLLKIMKNATRMGNLIDDLLAFAQLGRREVNKRQIDMNQLVRSVINSIEESNKHHAQIKVGDLPPAMADYSLMEHVVMNLLSNAIKYSSKKDSPVIEIKAESGNNELTYSIRDNGAGFDMQYASKLFGVFQRLHSGEEFDGTGVGLAIVQRIVNKHGGHVWAEAKPDEGACFFFSLPIQ